ncbi:MAG: hypothetical protein V1827_04535, partial [Candidatus Micrarchaeota archaeon]
PMLSLGLSMQGGMGMKPRLEQRLTFEQMHPLLELIAFYDRAKPMEISIKDERTGKEVHVSYVIAPHRLMDYVHEGEPFGVHTHDMIFVSDRTPPRMVPVVVMKLFEERFIDPGLDETGRVQHVIAAIDSLRFAELFGLTRDEIRSFVEKLIERDPSGMLELDPGIRKYLGAPSWKVPEKAAYLEAHMADWRVRRSKAMSGVLASDETGQRCFRDFRVSKADLILAKVSHVNPYLLGQFIRRASTIPLGMHFEVDGVMSGPAYALSQDECGVDLIRFLGTGAEERSNTVVRSSGENKVESTWRSLVVRVESGLLTLERGVEKRMEALKGKTPATTAIEPIHVGYVGRRPADKPTEPALDIESLKERNLVEASSPPTRDQMAFLKGLKSALEESY